MTESFALYRRRVLGYLGARDPMRVLRATPGRLARQVEGHTRAALARRPAPLKWSVVEIVAHLADAELAFAWRIRSMVASPGVRLQWWDEHLWSEKSAYARTDVRDSLRTFGALRSSTLALLRRVPEPSLRAAYGIHEKRGRQTVHDFVVMEAAHDLNHLGQVRALLEGR
jgi:uncharacterized damage-inducible protein DinB